MGLEVGSFVDDLVVTNPLATDAVGLGDDHLRLIKNCVKATFPQMGGTFSKATQQDATVVITALQNTQSLAITASATTTTLLTLPASASITSGWYIDLNTLATGQATVTPASGSINGAANFSIPSGTYARITYMGASVWRASRIPNGQAAATFANNLSVLGTLSVSGAVALSTTLSVSGAAHFGTTVSVGGAATFSQGVTISGAATLLGTLSVSGGATLAGTLSVSGAVCLSTTLSVSGAASFGAGVTISGAANLLTTLSVSGVAKFRSGVSISGAANFLTTMSVSGAANFASTVTVSGAAVFKSGITVSGVAVIAGALSVSGNAVFNANVLVNGTMTVSGAATFNGPVSISGAAVFNGGVTVSGATVLSGTLSVSGTAVLNNNVTIAGTLTVSGTVVLTIGQIQFPASQVSNAGANVLDDYEEGTFTPTLTLNVPGTLVVAYSNRLGQYTKVGNLVSATINITTNTWTIGTGSGLLLVSGFPFTTSASMSFYVSVVDWQGLTLGGGLTQVDGLISGSASTMQFISMGSGLARSSIISTNTTSGTQITINSALSYEV